MAYTAEQLSFLKGMVESTTVGSFSTITTSFNERFGTMVTRNAILGLAHRKKWAGRGRANKPANVKLPKVATETQTLNRILAAKKIRERGEDSGLAKSIKKVAVPWQDGEEAVELERETIPTRIPLVASLDHHCKWPAADDGSASMVCGAKTISTPNGHSYCGPHARRLVAKPRGAHEVFRDSRTARTGQFA